MIVSAIAAIDEKRGLGKNNGLLFRFPADSKRVREKTKGHPIIMGRRTYDSIGRPLPNRTNIVITRDHNYSLPGILVVHSLDDAIKIAKETEEPKETKETEGEIFIFGGGEIFKEALPQTQRLYLTVVEGDYKADTFFPDYSEFKHVIKEETGEDSGYKYIFLDLTR